MHISGKRELAVAISSFEDNPLVVLLILLLLSSVSSALLSFLFSNVFAEVKYSDNILGDKRIVFH